MGVFCLQYIMVIVRKTTLAFISKQDVIFVMVIQDAEIDVGVLVWLFYLHVLM
jgi:hypothetical protein